MLEKRFLLANSFYNSEEYFNYQAQSSDNWQKMERIIPLIYNCILLVLVILLIKTNVQQQYNIYPIFIG
jgi:hypothetical protein